jgi:hypothetical protein
MQGYVRTFTTILPDGSFLAGFCQGRQEFWAPRGYHRDCFRPHTVYLRGVNRP